LFGIKRIVESAQAGTKAGKGLPLTEYQQAKFLNSSWLADKICWIRQWLTAYKENYQIFEQINALGTDLALSSALTCSN
jgi:hypothetical protein